MAYRVRIEHAGYDENPLTFKTTITLAEYLAWVSRAKEFDGKIYFSMKLVEDEDDE